jgi:hypothetical protein
MEEFSLRRFLAFQELDVVDPSRRLLPFPERDGGKSPSARFESPDTNLLVNCSVLTRPVGARVFEGAAVGDALHEVRVLPNPVSP